MTAAKRGHLWRKWQHRVRLDLMCRRGEACPACGYVYADGLSGVTGEGTTGFSASRDATLTICTRCRKLLAVPRDQAKPLRLLSELEVFLLSDDDRKMIADATELIDYYTAGWD